jgi:biotin transport system substrate-specific component
MSHSKAVYSELLEHRGGRITKTVIVVFFGSCFLAILSQLAIPLPFTPVPLTLQTLGVFLLGGVLGSRLATYSVLAYLAQGSCGLPVFAGGLAGPLWLFDAKAGFLISFIIAAFLIGKMIEKRPSANLLYILFSLFLGQLMISATGMAWLSFYVGLHQAFLFGVLPFLSGAAVKITSAALILKGHAICKT